MKHYVNEEDCWYSCPKSGECCNETLDPTLCTCGADTVNAELEELKKDKAELLSFLQEVDDKVKLGQFNLRSYYLLNKHTPKP